MKKKIIEYLEKDYTKAEFYILDVSTFDNSSKYISILLQNLLFYLSDYKPDIAFITIKLKFLHSWYEFIFQILKMQNIVNSI